MAETIEIVRLDAAGNVVETLVDHVPAGWSAARTEFGKLRHGETGTKAAAAGGCLELRVGGVAIRVETCIKRPAPSTRRCPSRLGRLDGVEVDHGLDGVEDDQVPHRSRR